VHVHRILMVRRGHHLCLPDTLHFLKIAPSKTTLSIIINYQVRGHTSFLVLISTNQKQELTMATMFFVQLGWNDEILQRTFHRCLLNFDLFGQVVSEEKIFRNRPTRNKNCLWWPYLLRDQDKNSNLYRGHCIDASYQVSVHIAKRFQRRRFFRS
jgi:hypothetical protein